MSEIYHEFMTSPACLLIWQKKFIYQGLYFSSEMATLPPEIEAGVTVTVRSSIVIVHRTNGNLYHPPPSYYSRNFLPSL